MESGDVKTNVLNEKGRILQVENTIKRISLANTALGIVCTDGVILLGLKSEKSNENEKIYKLWDGIYCVIAGLIPDCKQIITYARHRAADFEEKYDSRIPTATLAMDLGRLLSRFTIEGGMRPFCTSIVICGFDEGKYSIYSCDPSGTVMKWVMKCFGKFEDKINKNSKFGALSIDESMNEIFDDLKKHTELNSLDVPKLEVCHYRYDSVKFLPESEVAVFFK